MHKTRLQDLCQKRAWPSPSYKISREGPDHNPSFSASVIIEGRTFEAPDFYKSLKEAQNKAAEVALIHLSSVVSSSSSSPSHPAFNAPPLAAKDQNKAAEVALIHLSSNVSSSSSSPSHPAFNAPPLAASECPQLFLLSI